MSILPNEPVDAVRASEIPSLVAAIASQNPTAIEHELDADLPPQYAALVDIVPKTKMGVVFLTIGAATYLAFLVAVLAIDIYNAVKK